RGRNAAIDRLLKDNLLDVVLREFTLDQRGARVQAEFFPAAKGDHGGNDDETARALVEMRPLPHVAPAGSGKKIEKIGVEIVPARDRAVDPGGAQDLAALLHAGGKTLLVVHGALLAKKFFENFCVLLALFDV